MSLKWLQWAYDQKVGHQDAKAVLVYLGNLGNPINADDEATIALIPELLLPWRPQLGYSFPSQKDIHEVTEIPGRSVRRALDFLEERDLILKLERRRKNGKKLSPSYLLITQEVRVASGLQAARVASGPVASMAGGTIEDTQGLDTQEGIKLPLALESENPPLPPVTPLRWTDDLTEADWLAVDKARVMRNGQSLSREYLADQYEAWTRDPDKAPHTSVLGHFLKFIYEHKRRNKL